MLAPVNEPGIQLYVEAPVAVIVVLLPEQMIAGFAEVFTTGIAFTVIVLVAVFVHPAAFVAVTVYMVFAVGLTVTGLPLNEPGIQLNDVPVPPAVNVEEAPAQIAAGLAETDTVGLALTVMVRVAVFVQPAELVPVTV